MALEINHHGKKDCENKIKKLPPGAAANAGVAGVK